MKRYTIEKIIDNKIVIWCTTVEQAQKLAEANGYTEIKWNLFGNSNGFEVYIEYKNSCPHWQDGYNKTYFTKKFNATKCIDFNQVLFKESYMFPYY